MVGLVTQLLCSLHSLWGEKEVITWEYCRICGVYVGRQIGPVWGLSYILVKAEDDICLDMCYMPLGHRVCVRLA